MMSKLLIVLAIILVQQHYCDSHSLGKQKWSNLLSQVLMNIASDYESTRGFYGLPTFTKFNLKNRNTVFPSVNITSLVLYGFTFGTITRSSDYNVKQLGNGVTELSTSVAAVMDLSGVIHFETQEGSSVMNHTTDFHSHLSNYPDYAHIPVVLHFNQNTNSMKVVKMDHKYEDTWNEVSSCNIPEITKEMCEDIHAVSTKYVLDGRKIQQHLTKRLTKIIESGKYEMEDDD